MACSPHAGCTAATEAAVACRRGMHAGGMHVGRAVSTAAAFGAAGRGVHAVRMQAACRWGAVCRYVHRPRVQRHAVGM